MKHTQTIVNATLALAIVVVAALLYTSYADTDATGDAVLYGGKAVGEAGGNDALVCCTFEHDGEEKTCAVPMGRDCTICESVC